MLRVRRVAALATETGSCSYGEKGQVEGVLRAREESESISLLEDVEI